MSETPRRSRRKRNILIALALLPVAWIGHQIWWWSTYQPAPLEQYGATLEELSASHQPEGPNGWATLEDAIDLYDEARAQITALNLTSHEQRPGGFYGPVDFGNLLIGAYELDLIEPERRVLERFDENGGRALLAEAEASPRAVRPMIAPSPLYNMTFPDLAWSRDLTRALCASMRIAHQADDQERCIASFEQSLALGRITAHQPTVIARLVGHSITSMALAELRHELAERPIDVQTGQRLFDAMDRQVVYPPMSMTLEAERLITMDAIQHFFTDDRHGDGELDIAKFEQWLQNTSGGTPGSGTPIEDFVVSLILAGRAETTDLANQYYEALKKNADLDWVARPTSGVDMTPITAQITDRFAFLQTMLPNLEKAVEQNDRGMMVIAATRIMIAIEIHRAIHGRLPASLDELAPDILSEVPLDPLRGGPFIYRLMEDDPAGTGYFLGSTGPDQTEDTADMSFAEMDGLLAPWISAVGMDFQYNPPRPKRGE